MILLFAYVILKYLLYMPNRSWLFLHMPLWNISCIRLIQVDWSMDLVISVNISYPWPIIHLFIIILFYLIQHSIMKVWTILQWNRLYLKVEFRFLRFQLEILVLISISISYFNQIISNLSPLIFVNMNKIFKNFIRPNFKQWNANPRGI